MTTTRKKDWRKPTVKLNSGNRHKSNLKGENKMKKFGAIVLAIMMIAMVGLAYATTTGTDTTNDDTGSLNSNPANTAIKIVSGNTLTLNKSLIFYNPENVGVYEPNIAYTYTVSPFTVTSSSATVTDKDSVTYHVKSGVDGGLIVASTNNTSYANTNTKVSATSAGTIVEKSILLTVVPTAFSSAGIYRYKLTDTTTVDSLDAVGITRPADYKTDRYIDLYVQNDGNDSTTGNPKFKVENAVVFVETSVTDPATGTITTSTLKTTGYNESQQADSDYTDDTVADHYYTYNLKIEKETTGNMADRSNQFPFAVAITGIKAGKITYAGVGITAANAIDETVTSGSVTKGELTTSSALKLADGQSVTFYGIPFGASATVSEYNNTLDVYKELKNLTTTSNASTQVKLSDDVTLTPNTPTEKAELASILIDAGTAHTATDTTQSSAHTTLAHFTNNLAEISPTGYVSRFAPYALILVAGIVLLIVAKKRKHTEED